MRKATWVSSSLTLLLTLAILLFATPVMAQSAGTGSISGVVTDATGAVVPDATVTIENATKGIRREVVTNSAGVFTAPALVPAGGYRVTVSKTGFASFEVKDITITVGGNIDLTPTLRVAGASTEVVVTDAAPVVDTTKTDISQVVDSKQILDLPSNSRRVDAFVLLTPGVTADGSFGLLSFRGSPGGNEFLTDGLSTSNGFYNENSGRTRTYNISQDAVQEFEVVSSNFAAEYGRASGGVVNTVTRSGGNEFHGSVYEHFRNRTLYAKDPTIPKTPQYPNGINPPEWRHQFGASVSGPIVKNKLFFFANGELMRRKAPLVSSNLGNGIFDSAGNYVPTYTNAAGQTLPTCDTAVATQAQCDAAIAYIKTRVDSQLIDRRMNNDMLFAKIDYRPTDRDTFSFSSNYVDFESPNGIQTQLSLTGGSGIGNNANTTVKHRTGAVNWTHIISNSAINEFRFGVFKDRQFDPASPDLLPPFGPVQLSIASSNGTVGNLGYATNYPRLNPSEFRYQFSNSVSWTVGSHTFKFGGDIAHTEDYQNSLYNRYGSFSYANLTDFALDFSGTTTGKHWRSYSQAFGNPEVRIKVTEYSAFAQDTWRITPKLTLTPGIRYDYANLPKGLTANPAFPLTGRIPETTLNFAPRLGIAYAFNDKTVVRAGYGLFHNRYPAATLSSFITGNGLYQQTYSLANNIPAQLAAGPAFPNNLETPPNVTGSASIIQADPDFRNAYSQQLSVGVDRELGRKTSLSLAYNWSRTLHLLQTMDANIKAPNADITYTYPILNATGEKVGEYTTPLYLRADRINSAYGGVYQLQSAGNAYYNALLANLKVNAFSWMQAQVAYTYGHAIDYNQGGGGNTLFGATFPTSVFNGDYAAEKGSSSSDVRHRLVTNAIFEPKFMNGGSFVADYLVNGWQLSFVNVFSTSQPLVPTVSVTDYPRRADNGTSITLARNSSLNGLGGSNRVPFDSISDLEVGNIYRTDMRLGKSLPITEDVKLAIAFEAFNVFNTLIPGGPSPRRTQKYATQLQPNTLADGSPNPLAGKVALVPVKNYGELQQTQAPPDGTTARRAQVVLRLSF